MTVVDFTPAKPRDAQRARVYRAERAVWAAGEVGRRYVQAWDLLRSAYRAVDSHWWSDAGFREVGNVGVGRQRSGASCRQDGGSVLLRFEPVMMDDATLAHELSHAAQPVGSADHGREFCAAYLEIAAHLLGYRYASALRAAFDAERVAYDLEAA